MSNKAKHTNIINFYCTDEMLEWIKQKSDIEKTTETQLIRDILQAAMDKANTQAERIRIYGSGFL